MVTTHDIPRAVPRDGILTSRGACRYTSVNRLSINGMSRPWQFASLVAPSGSVPSFERFSVKQLDDTVKCQFISQLAHGLVRRFNQPGHCGQGTPAFAIDTLLIVKMVTVGDY